MACFLFAALIFWKIASSQSAINDIPKITYPLTVTNGGSYDSPELKKSYIDFTYLKRFDENGLIAGLNKAQMVYLANISGDHQMRAAATAKVDFGDAGANPLVTIQKLGASVLEAIQGLMVGVIGIGGVASFFGAGAIVQAIVTFLMPIVLMALVPAFVLAFFIPFLPFLIWAGSLVGWVLLVVQAVIGIPLFLVSFIRNDESFIGRSGQQLIMLLEVFLRPSLMVLALYFSLLLMAPILNFLTDSFLFVMGSIDAENSSWLTLFYSLAVLSFYTLLAFNLSKLMVNLIEELPNKILQWLGTNVNSLVGNLGQNLDNSMERGVKATSGGAGAVIGGGFNQSMNGMTAIKKKKVLNNKEL